MTKPNRLPLTRAIFAASLALTATIASFTATASPAQAAAPRNAYSAGLVTPLAAPRREIIGGLLWKCEGGRCDSAGEGSRTVLVCARVAKKFGPVARFTAPDGVLSAEDLARCNAG